MMKRYAGAILTLMVITFLMNAPGALAQLPDLGIHREGRQLTIGEVTGGVTPQLQQAVDAFNAGSLEESLRLFRAMENKTLGFIGEAYVVGDLEFDEGYHTPAFTELASRFRAALQADPDNAALKGYTRAVNLLGGLKMSRKLGNARESANALMSLGVRNNPFYYKARLYQARVIYWDGAEGGNPKVKEQAIGIMKGLAAVWPENRILKQYMGDSVPWGEELIADTERDPAWATSLREAYARQIRVMRRWFTVRQFPDGQLGGGWGDDVELLRTWTQIAAISTGPEDVSAGIQRLVDGMWDTELEEGGGYSMDPGGDVEHSAEPSADTLPTMLFLRYGDPLYVERNMQSCKTIRDLYMGVDRKGYPRFRSSWFGARIVKTAPIHGGDTGYNARAMKHFLWLGWWGNPDAKDWFVRWADGWRAATVIPYDTKPPGLPPCSLFYPSGEPIPTEFASWWDGPWHAYGGGMGGMIHDSMLAAYYLSRDPKFLKPFQLLAKYGSRPLVRADPPEGTPERFESRMAHMIDASKASLYHWLTGERVYDEYAKRYSDPAQVYRVDYDLARFQHSFEGTAKRLRDNLEFMTTEVLATDRAALPGALSVFGAYTGAIQNLRDAATPTFAVTYDTPDENFAALVVEATEERVRVWLYGFWDKETRVGLRLWQLQPGWYIMDQGIAQDAEFDYQKRYDWRPSQRVKLTHRADTVYVNLPPSKTYVVDLRLDSPVSVPAAAPDLAIHPRDLQMKDGRLDITVHNVGSTDTKPFHVALQTIEGNAWKTVGTRKLAGLPSPRDLTPSTATIRFDGLKKSRYRVLLDPRDVQYEICESNNVAEVEATPVSERGQVN